MKSTEFIKDCIDLNVNESSTELVLNCKNNLDKIENMSKSEEKKNEKPCEQISVKNVKEEVACSKFDQEDELNKEEILLDDLLKSKYDGRTIQLPDFAIVYSFLELFGVFLELPYITMPELEHSLDSTKVFTGGEDSGVLESLHTKLFRKLSKSPRFSILSNFKPNKLSKTVLKFAQMAELPFAWDLEQFGYHILTCAQKLQLLKALCDIQFDENPRFKSILFEAYKADQGASLRLSPFGYEQDGKTVWFHEDGEYNVQVYAGELEETDMWQVRAGNLDDLTEYISILKKLSEVNPKDVAAEKLRLRNAAKQKEKEKRRLEREHQRQLLKEEKNDKKRGRKTKVINTSESEEEDDGCCRCLANNQSDLVLLCDGCDAAYHTLCLRPPVETIPEGDWFCPFCLQVKLIEALEVKLNELNAKIKARERKSKRMVFYGINSANIVDKTSEDNATRRSGRGAKRIDYNFSEYDEMIKKAVNAKDEKELLPCGRVSARNTKQKRQRRKLNDLDTDNEDDYDSGDNSFSNYDSDQRDDMKHFINDHLDETEERHRNKHLRSSRRFKTRRKRLNIDDDDEGSNKSESDGFDSKIPKRRLRQRKVTRYDETAFSSENEGSIKSINVEEGDEWIGDEPSSESESEDLNSEVSDSPKPRRTLRHRQVKNKVNLCEDDSEEDDEDYDLSEESSIEVNSDKDKQVTDSKPVVQNLNEEQTHNKNGDEGQCRDPIAQNTLADNGQVKPIEHSGIKSLDNVKVLKPSPTKKELNEGDSNTICMTFTVANTILSSPVIQQANKPSAFCHPRERFNQVIKSKSPSGSPTKTSGNIQQQQPIIQPVPFLKTSTVPLHPREIYNNLLKNKVTEMPNPSTQNTSSTFIHHSSPSTLCQSFSSASSLGCTTIQTLNQNSSFNASFHNITSTQDMNPHSSRLQFNNIHGNYFSNSGYEPSYTQSQRFSSPGCLPPQQIGLQSHSYNHSTNSSLGFYPMRSTPYCPRQQEQYRPSPAFPNVHGSTGYPFMESVASSPNFYPPYEYSDQVRPPVHVGVYPYSQYSGIQNVKQDRDIKKQLKEQAKQERELKKLEKLQEKERKKQKKVSTVNHGMDGKSNMNFFRNMVISPDNNKGDDTHEQFQ
nr:remodeling and spacing factor 1 isoform X2 [Hydra vulgaris]